MQTNDQVEPTDGPTVLVLDDEEPIRRAVQRVLELYNYRVLTAENAHEAAVIVKTATRVDLLLCDLVLPGLNGREAASMLLGHQPEMKVLYMSGYSSLDSHRKQLEDSGEPFLPKPFEVDELVQAVETVLG